MHQLLPDARELSVEDLAGLMLVAQRPIRGWHVRSNMIATIDGAVRGPSGTSVDISNATDRAMLGMLRGISDAVIVGSRNALAQPYLPLPAKERWQTLRREHGMAPAPQLVVVTNTGLPVDAPCFTTGNTPTIVVTSERCSADALVAMRAVATVIVAGGNAVDFHSALDQLAQMGLWRVLCEGGPSLLASMSTTGVLDEMCVTTASLWSGAAGEAMTSGGMPPLPAPTSMALARLLVDDDDYIYAHWVRENLT